MNTTVDNINIPNVTVSQIINTLEKLYLGAFEMDIPTKKLPTPFLWGAPGIGKSDAIKQLAAKMERHTGKRCEVTDVRLLLFTPADLMGIPHAVDGKTRWLKPKIFDMDDDENVINFLFLDELSAAPQSVQAAAYQICLDRRIQEHKLPDNCIVIAAGNRMTDQSLSYKMPKALCNRLMHFNVVSNFASWKDWAINNGISSLVIAYLTMDSNRLCTTPEAGDLAYCTPRSWEFVSNVIKAYSDDVSAAYTMIEACVGNDVAFEFESFCRGVARMPDVNDIFSGVCFEYPKSHDVVYALISALVARIASQSDEITAQQLENVCDYISHFPKDFVMLFVHDLRLVKGINKKLMGCYSLQRILSSK